jgi:hypothetical protein
MMNLRCRSGSSVALLTSQNSAGLKSSSSVFCLHYRNSLQVDLVLVQNSLNESKTAHFHLFSVMYPGYAPSKTQKLTKNQPVFATGRES